MIIKGLVYILQSEHYSVGRFLQFAYTHWNWLALEKRQKLKPTKKSVLIIIESWLLVLAVVVLSIWLFYWWGLLSLLVVYILAPFIVAIIFYLVWPIDFVLKNRILEAARKELKKRNTIIIGITGSYGKTSMKNILESILRKKFNVIKTPDSVNTDIGVAQFILQNISSDVEIFIVEMGAYKMGDIAKICRLVGPHYALLTGINESHLERFGALENTIAAKFELPETANKKSYLNFDDDRVREHYERFKINEVVGFSKDEVEDLAAKDNFAGIEFEYQGQKFITKLLAFHNAGLILAGIKLARELGMDWKDIGRGVAEVNYVPHRLKPIFNKQIGVTIIDDSYNANFDGVKSGLEVLNRAEARKLILTPGPLVELGKMTETVHNKIGELYAKNVDLALLIDSPATRAVRSGMERAGSKNYKIYPTTEAAHEDLKNILESGDTILFQNDWPDIYF